MLTQLENWPKGGLPGKEVGEHNDAVDCQDVREEV